MPDVISRDRADPPAAAADGPHGRNRPPDTLSIRLAPIFLEANISAHIDCRTLYMVACMRRGMTEAAAQLSWQAGLENLRRKHADALEARRTLEESMY